MIQLERKDSEEKLKRIEWLLKPKSFEKEQYLPNYGDLTKLNKNGIIINSVDKNILIDFTSDFLDLLETSSAIYEKNGDYALGIFSSNWCRFLDQSSRDLCSTENNKEALESGKWLCHESCWTQASKKSIETGQEIDIECNGGLHLYSVPIRAENEIVGSINFGYGDPPKDQEELKNIAEKYKVSLNELSELSYSNETRPPFITDLAKRQIKRVARMIGYIIERKKAEEKAIESERKYREAYDKANFYKELIAHDMNNILQTIQSSVELYNLFQKSPENFKYRKDVFDIISSQVFRGANLVSNIIKLSEIEETKFPTKIIEAKRILDNSIEHVYRSYQGLKLNIKVETDMMKIYLKANELLSDLFENLLVNAVKHNENPEIEIQIKISEEILNEIRYIKFEFVDNGIGIPDEIKQELFEKSIDRKRSKKGLGIGLSLVKQIISSFNGTIHIENRIKGDYKKGSDFIVLIPTAD